MGYFTLQRLARAQGVELRPGTKIPTFEYPSTIERELFGIYREVTDAWWRASKDLILPTYLSGVETERERDKRMAALGRDSVAVLDDVKDGARAVNEANQMIERLIATLTDDVETWALGVEKYQRDKFVSVVYTATSIELNTVLSALDMAPTVEAVVERNMSLIRDVSEQTRQRIADIFFRNYQQRTPLRSVAKQISDAVGLARDRALRIASDQTVKLAALLDEQRQRDVGIESFIWVHSGKVHYRPEHKARNGKRYKWSTAKSVLRGDLPGVLPFCGCKAQGVLD